MDKFSISWLKNTNEYKKGLNTFLDFAFECQSIKGRKLCHCHSCKFKKWSTRVRMHDHLLESNFSLYML